MERKEKKRKEKEKEKEKDEEEEGRQRRPSFKKKVQKWAADAVMPKKEGAFFIPEQPPAISAISFAEEASSSTSSLPLSPRSSSHSTEQQQQQQNLPTLTSSSSGVKLDAYIVYLSSLTEEEKPKDRGRSAARSLSPARRLRSLSGTRKKSEVVLEPIAEELRDIAPFADVFNRQMIEEEERRTVTNDSAAVERLRTMILSRLSDVTKNIPNLRYYCYEQGETAEVEKKEPEIDLEFSPPPALNQTLSATSLGSAGSSSSSGSLNIQSILGSKRFLVPSPELDMQQPIYFLLNLVVGLCVCGESVVDSLSSLRRTPILLQSMQALFTRYILLANSHILACTDEFLRLQLEFLASELRSTVFQFFGIIRTIGRQTDKSDAESHFLQLGCLCENLVSLVNEHDSVFAASVLRDEEAKKSHDPVNEDSGKEPEESEDDVRFEEEPTPSATEGEPEQTSREPKKIVAASLHFLIKQLTSEELSDQNLTKTFLATYQSVCSPPLLLHTLVQRWVSVSQPNKQLPKNIPESDWVDRVQKPIRLRICNFFRFWVETRFSDFDEEMQQTLLGFIETKVSVELPRTATTLLTILHKIQADTRGKRTRPLFSPHSTLDCDITPLSVLTSEMFDTHDIASHITLIDARYFTALHSSELLQQAWNKPKLRHRAPNVSSIIARFNQLSGWVSSTIVCEMSAKERKKKYVKFLKINQEFRKLNNFNAIAAVNAGLNVSGIHRLKGLKSGLNKSLEEAQVQLETLMDPQGSYAKYRDTIHSINPPCVPFLGVYLRDLVFIEDGNPDFLEFENKQLINFQKCRYAYNVIAEIQQYQQTPYNIQEIEPLASMLGRLPAISADAVFELSLRHEPRQN
eukprot:TRINITY_DN11970_c0_g1_i1.p1 TRINITY_DN11970_c0_g1~~TRINITY_DN11970_c0_g1_i1.p1  ORF type:complete len:866 (+),score=210.34 TRINITY_DN11970_c0_g1_i1:24-2600(+)